MDWITESIAIGSYLEARDPELLREKAIASALSLDRTLQPADAIALGLKRVEAVPLEDAAGNDPRLFRMAIDALSCLVQEAAPVLVQCHAGRSRSAVVVAGYLMVALGIDAEEALARVAAKRPIAVTAGVERLLHTLQ